MLICSNNVNTVFVPLSKHSNCAFKPRWKDHIYDMNAHECHHHVTGFESTFFYSFFPWGFFFNSLVLQGMNQPNQLRNYEILFEAKKYLRCFMEVDAPSKLFCPDFYLFIYFCPGIFSTASWVMYFLFIYFFFTMDSTVKYDYFKNKLK